jgi:tRNA A37 threonylcarbamoyladenosine dehydratase
MNEQFIRTQMLLGTAAVEKLQRSHVLVVGLGGVGSYAAEALARAGVGELTVLDSDTVSVSNLNRQLEALHSTVGLPKAEVVARRCRDINPDIVIHPLVMQYSPDHRFADWHWDYMVDAIDLVSCKLDLIEQAMLHRIPILSALGTGNKLDPSRLEITDISKTSVCPLARVMRRELRARGIQHLKVIYSPEPAVTPLPLEAPPPGRRSVPASAPWVPSCAGLMMGGAVVMDLTAKERSVNP